MVVRNEMVKNLVGLSSNFTPILEGRIDMVGRPRNVNQNTKIYGITMEVDNVQEEIVLGSYVLVKMETEVVVNAFDIAEKIIH